MRFYYGPFFKLDRLFDDAFATRFYLIPSTSCASSNPAQCLDSSGPRMDLHESKDFNTMTATFELPGLKSEDVAIDVHQKLAIWIPLLQKRREGLRFLPFGTKPEDVSAKMENGLLTVTFPKTTPEQEAKRIFVQ